MRKINELSDLIDNEELTLKYLGSSNTIKISEKFNYEYSTAKSCILNNTELELSKQTFDIVNWFRENYILKSFLDIIPYGVLVPIDKVSGSIELNTIKGLMSYNYNCTTNTIIPIKKENEIYLIFPYGMIVNKIVEPNKIQVYPVWDILVVPNLLLDKPIDSPLYC